MNAISQTDTGGNAKFIDVEGDLAFVIDRNSEDFSKLVIINISNPYEPEIINSTEYSPWLFAVDVVGDIAYLADAIRGLKILNVSDPTSPTLLNTYGSFEMFFDVQIVGDIAYLADYEGGLITLNISNPSSPVKLDEYHISGGCPFAEIYEERAYIVDHQDGYSRLVVVNVSDPANLSLLGSFSQINAEFWNPAVYQEASASIRPFFDS